MLVPEKYKDHLQLSNSRMNAFSNCNRKFYWSYKKELTTTYGATPLRYGKAWHKVMECYYSHIKEYGWGNKDPLGVTAIEAGLSGLRDCWDAESEDLEWTDDYRTLEACAEAFIAYVAEFKEEKSSLEIIATEFKYMTPITLTEEEDKLFPYLKGKSVLFTGIIDMIVKEYGHIWAYEHKTTGAWMQSIIATLRRSAQTQGYLWNVKEEYTPKGIMVEGIMVNLHHLSAGKLKGGGYGKKKIEFKRDPQMYSDGDFREWRRSSLAVLNDMVRAEELDFYPMNLSKCHEYNKPCQFTSLCEQNKVNLTETNTDSFIKRKRDV